MLVAAAAPARSCRRAGVTRSPRERPPAPPPDPGRLQGSRAPRGSRAGSEQGSRRTDRSPPRHRRTSDGGGPTRNSSEPVLIRARPRGARILKPARIRRGPRVALLAGSELLPARRQLRAGAAGGDEHRGAAPKGRRSRGVVTSRALSMSRRTRLPVPPLADDEAAELSSPARRPPNPTSHSASRNAAAVAEHGTLDGLPLAISGGEQSFCSGSLSRDRNRLDPPRRDDADAPQHQAERFRTTAPKRATTCSSPIAAVFARSCCRRLDAGRGRGRLRR